MFDDVGVNIWKLQLIQYDLYLLYLWLRKLGYSFAWACHLRAGTLHNPVVGLLEVIGFTWYATFLDRLSKDRCHTLMFSDAVYETLDT